MFRPLGRFVAAAIVGVSIAAGAFTAGQITAQPVPAAVTDGKLQQEFTCVPLPTSQAIYGDSITSWKPAFANDWRQSWVYWASSNEFPASHGWALPGATLAEMAAHATDSPARVVQIMGGTNDLPIPAVGKVGTPKDQMIASIDRIVAVENPQKVVILAVPPFGWNYYESNLWNQELRAHAEFRGWQFFDPWTGLRDPSGAWWPGTSSDLVHPSPLYTWHPGSLIYTNLKNL